MIPQIAHIINEVMRAIAGAIKCQTASSCEAIKIGDNMCRVLMFYSETYSEIQCAEWDLPYGKELQAHIDHCKDWLKEEVNGWVTTEHIDLV